MGVLVPANPVTTPYTVIRQAISSRYKGHGWKSTDYIALRRGLPMEASSPPLCRDRGRNVRECATNSVRGGYC